MPVPPRPAVRVRSDARSSAVPATSAGFSHRTLKPSPPLSAKPFTREYLWNPKGLGSILDSCYETRGLVTEMEKYFPEAVQDNNAEMNEMLLLDLVNH